MEVIYFSGKQFTISQDKSRGRFLAEENCAMGLVAVVFCILHHGPQHRKKDVVLLSMFLKSSPKKQHISELSR